MGAVLPSGGLLRWARAARRLSPGRSLGSRYSPPRCLLTPMLTLHAPCCAHGAEATSGVSSCALLQYLSVLAGYLPLLGVRSEPQVGGHPALAIIIKHAETRDLPVTCTGPLTRVSRHDMCFLRPLRGPGKSQCGFAKKTHPSLSNLIQAACELVDRTMTTMTSQIFRILSQISWFSQ